MGRREVEREERKAMLQIRGSINDMRVAVDNIVANLTRIDAPWTPRVKDWMDFAVLAHKSTAAAIPPPKANSHLGRPYGKMRTEPLLRCLQCEVLVWQRELEDHLYFHHKIKVQDLDHLHSYYSVPTNPKDDYDEEPERRGLPVTATATDIEDWSPRAVIRWSIREFLVEYGKVNA